jgi:imidazole glycerol-phosphate synthase subunit HisF
MFRPRLIPVLLLKGNGLVKTKKFLKPTYIGDPLNAVQIFNKYKADELIFLDIEASKQGRTISVDLVKSIGDESFMSFAVGGGINSLEAAERLIHAGAEKVVLNTIAYTNANLITEITDVFGRQSVVVSIDVKMNLFGKYKVYVKSGTMKTGLTPIEFAKSVEEKGAGEIMITSIAREGMMNGLDLNLIESVQKEVQIPVIGHGGMYSLDHFKQGIEHGASAIAGGSFFVYAGKQKGILMNYPAKEKLKKLFLK